MNERICVRSEGLGQLVWERIRGFVEREIGHVVLEKGEVDQEQYGYHTEGMCYYVGCGSITSVARHVGASWFERSLAILQVSAWWILQASL